MLICDIGNSASAGIDMKDRHDSRLRRNSRQQSTPDERPNVRARRCTVPAPSHWMQRQSSSLHCARATHLQDPTRKKVSRTSPEPSRKATRGNGGPVSTQKPPARKVSHLTRRRTLHCRVYRSHTIPPHWWGCGGEGGWGVREGLGWGGRGGVWGG